MTRGRDLGAGRTTTDAHARTRRGLRHLPAALVAITLAAASISLAFVTNNVVRDQERALLSERANEVVILLQTTFFSYRSTLTGVGAAALAETADPTVFQSLAAPTTQNGATLVVARRDGSSYTTVAAAGEGAPGVAEPLDPQAVETAERALKDGDMASAVVGSGSSRRLVLALGVPGTSDVVSVAENPLPEGGTTQADDPSSPYRELNVAVYASSEIDPDTRVLSSGDVDAVTDASDDQVSLDLPVGADQWLVVASPREPLVGGLAERLPWLVVGTGLLLALTLGVVVDLITRRRAYALKLVEERTASLRAAQEAAERANRAKSEFLSRMSHELRTPLNAVLGFAQLLGLDDLTEDQRENVRQIDRGGRHLLDLINEILDISRIETERMSLSNEPVLVADVIADAASLVRPLADDHGVRLLVANGCDGYVLADRQRLSQILLNLLSNGIKYNRLGGSVTLDCAKPSPEVLRIRVADTGPGIPEEHFDLLFAPFERLGAEQSGIEGTGVGLALSKGLAEAMGGTLGVETVMGHGSTFWLDLPVAEAPEILTQPFPATGDTPTVGLSEATILYVEDNPTNVKLVERVIARRPGVRLVTTPAGSDGPRLAVEHAPELVLLDLNLGDIPGVEVLRAMKQDGRTADVPVVVVSADAMPLQIEKLLAEGAAGYLTKPIDVDELLRIIDGVVEHRRNAPAGDR